MKDLSEIDDEYKAAVDDLFEEFQQKLSITKNREETEGEYKKRLRKLVEIRDKQSREFIEKNRGKLFEVVEKKPEKKEKKEVFQAYKFEFKRGFFERAGIFIKLKWFTFRLRVTSAWNHAVPFRAGYLINRGYFSLRSFISDLVMIFKKIYRAIARFVVKKYILVKEFVINVWSKFVKIYNGTKEKMKKRTEEKKKEGEIKEKTTKGDEKQTTKSEDIK